MGLDVSFQYLQFHLAQAVDRAVRWLFAFYQLDSMLIYTHVFR